MERHAFAMKIKEGKKNQFKANLGKVWPGLTALLDEHEATNFSMWNVLDMVFGYFDEDPVQGQPGHVCIVEKINKDAQGNIISIITSNSAFNHYLPPRYPQNDFPWFYLSEFEPSNYNYDILNHATVGTFIGFVYHPNFPPGPEPLNIAKLIALVTDQEMNGNIYINERRLKR